MITGLIISIFFVGSSSVVRAQSDLQIMDLEAVVNGTQVTFTWQTNQLARGRVDVGTTSSYGIYRDSGLGRWYDHAMTVEDLEPRTTYHYQVTVTGVSGQVVTTFDRTFKTGKRTRSDFDASEITDLRVLYYNDRDAFITFRTAEATRGWIEYGVAPNLNKKTSKTGLITYHEIKISGLQPGTLYHYVVSATDEAGNLSESAVQEFRSILTDDTRTEALDIGAARPVSATDPGLKETSAVVAWRINRPSSGIVQWGTSTKYGKKFERKEKQYEHAFVLSDLKPGTTYFFKITSKDLYGKSVSSEGSFVTHGITASATPVVTVKGISTFNASRTTSISAVYRASGSTRVYAIMNGQRHWLRTPEILQSYGLVLADVQVVPQSYLDRYRDARLVQVAGSDSVYYLYLQYGRKKKIATPAIFESYPSNAWKDVVVITRADVASMLDMEVVKTADSRTIYLITPQGTKRPFATPEAFLARGYQWNQIGIVNQIDLESYPMGEVIR